MYCQEFDNLLRDEMSLSIRKSQDVKKTMLSRKLIVKSEREKKWGGAQFIGLPADIARINEKMKQGEIQF